MSYAARADLEQAYGTDMVSRLAVRTDDPDGSASVARALTYASGLIDAQLSTRFALPLGAVPEILTTIAVDLAMGRMATTADLATDETRRREDKARAELKAIAEGKMNLGLPLIGVAAAPSGAAASPRPIIGPASCKMFTREGLRDL